DGIRTSHATGLQTCALPIYNHRMTGISRNKTTPEIRCKIEALALGERLTLITWLKGRLIGRLLFTAGTLFAVIPLYQLSTHYTNTIYQYYSTSGKQHMR